MNGILGDLVKEFRNGILTRRGFVIKAGALGLSAAATAALARDVEAQQEKPPAEVIWGMIASGAWEVIDLSLTTAHNYPTNWPTDPLFVQRPLASMGPPLMSATGYAVAGGSIVNVNLYEMTAHTGTQIDFPPHFVPPPGMNLPGANGNEWGLRTGDTYPLTWTMGPAVVLDARAVLAAKAENGKSAHINRAWVEKWEAKYGQLQPGDVPVLCPDYGDMYHKPFPNGDRSQDRLLWQPLMTKTAPGWAAFDPDAIDLMNERGVKHLAVDSPSFGYTENGQPPHVAGLSYGMSWTEGATSLGSLPLRGALYIFATYKVEKQEAGIGRAFAIKPAGADTVGATPPLAL